MRVRIPLDFVKHLRIGACSWKYDSWKGLYYDEDREYDPYDYLSDYAKFVNTVEIDQWFWSLFPGGLRFPEPETVRQYADSVPDDFVFSIKAPNAITLTHFYKKAGHYTVTLIVQTVGNHAFRATVPVHVR